MKTNEETLELALEAFWVKVAELRLERESRSLPPTVDYDLEKYARNAVESWLEMKKSVYYTVDQSRKCY